MRDECRTPGLYIMSDCLLLCILLYFLFINMIDNSTLNSNIYYVFKTIVFNIVYLRHITMNPNIEDFIEKCHHIIYIVF